MSIITLRAHFDGRRIQLDEPYNLDADTKLLVTILPKPKSDDTYEAWLALSAERLEDAYGDEEPEYSPDMIKEVNPDYEGR